jgi:hypothetical protein
MHAIMTNPGKLFMNDGTNFQSMVERILYRSRIIDAPNGMVHGEWMVLIEPFFTFHVFSI